MIRNLIWDFDGTLYDTYPPMAQAFWETLRMYGHDVPYHAVYDALKRSVGYALELFTEQCGLDNAFEGKYRVRRMEIEAHTAHPFPGVKNVLEQVCNTGGANFILTHRGATLRGMLERDGFDRFFRECVTTEYGFPRKPDPAGVYYLLDTHRLSAEETMMVGDRPLDILAGKNAGIRTCFFDPDGAVCPDSEFQVNDFEALTRLLKEEQ